MEIWQMLKLQHSRHQTHIYEIYEIIPYWDFTGNKICLSVEQNMFL